MSAVNDLYIISYKAVFTKHLSSPLYRVYRVLQQSVLVKINDKDWPMHVSYGRPGTKLVICPRRGLG